MAAGTHVDEDILREVVRLGFTRDFVTDSLKTRQQNKVWAGGGGDAAGRLSTGCAPGRRRGLVDTAGDAARALRLLTVLPSLRLPALLPQASVAYYLMADNRRRMPSSAYLKEEMTEANRRVAAVPLGCVAAPLALVPLAAPPCACAAPRATHRSPHARLDRKRQR